MSEAFSKIPPTEPIKEVIRSAFDLAVEVSGGWGYSLEDAIQLMPPLAAPLPQLEYTLASIRTHIEMHMTLPEEKRYGGINLNEVSRITKSEGHKTFDIVSYDVSAMKETEYARFIDAYKEGYGREDFDMEAHFQARKEATLHRSITLYFDITALQ